MSFKPVLDLSSNEDEAPPPKPRRGTKRVRSPAVSKEDRCSETFLRKIVSRRCLCSKKSCLHQFVNNPAFSDLLQYRVEWFALGKIDQDTVVACFDLSVKVFAPRHQSFKAWIAQVFANCPPWTHQGF